ncbi:MAG: SUF system NifU family Fe-S cluster assembly protein [Puniceicoccales bacterium]|nr:SUF system NifU family Fe-S cluster assembly protein [Puniceicoccales bacterium]
MNDMEELYQSIILEHNRNPQNFGKLSDATCSAKGYNANCGDDIRLFLKLDGSVLSDVRFSGEGCAISRASASLLTMAVKNISKDRAVAMAEEMLSLLTGKSQLMNDLSHLGSRVALLGVRKFPMRIKCATLPWHALIDALGEGNVAIRGKA